MVDGFKTRGKGHVIFLGFHKSMSLLKELIKLYSTSMPIFLVVTDKFLSGQGFFCHSSFVLGFKTTA